MKVFCIGFNKCGTHSFHQFFKKYGFISKHDSTFWWYCRDVKQMENIDCFTDGYERYNDTPTFPDLDFLESNFDDCKFILQTRNLKDWLASRYFQGSFNYLNGFKNKKKIDVFGFGQNWFSFFPEQLDRDMIMRMQSQMMANNPEQAQQLSRAQRRALKKRGH